MFAQSKGGGYSLTNGASGVADAIDFDGVTDYLSRSSDLVGNADGKTVTLSFWFEPNAAAAYTIYDAGGSFTVSTNASNQIVIIGKNAASTTILSMTITAPTYAVRTQNHCLLSFDLANVSNRSAYVNDVAATVTWTTYTNDSIDFTRASHAIAALSAGTVKAFARLSHVFVDYQYRNLSAEANRRLFITADRKPAAGQSALNPILYLPLNDPTQPGENLGTGGDFALNGVVARSGRGPSQFNAPYSDLNGASQYLSRASITGIADGKQFTFCASLNYDSSGSGFIFIGGASTNIRVSVSINGANKIALLAYNSSNTEILNAVSSEIITVGRNYVICGSIDLNSTSNRVVYINGSLSPMTWNTYTNGTIAFTGINNARVGVSLSGTSYLNGRLGNVFFDTRYIDLSQPANLAKFVTGTGIDAKPADLGANGEKPFGTPPLIYLPMYGNNAGKNYGMGGDFTVVSWPFDGSRGPNEFWGNKAKFDGSTGYLSRTSALAGVSDSRTFSTSFKFSTSSNVSSTQYLFYQGSVDNSGIFLIRITTGPTLEFVGYTSAKQFITSFSFPIAANTEYFVQVNIDLSNSTNRSVYVNGAAASVTWSTYTDGLIGFSSAYNVFATKGSSGGFQTPIFSGYLSEFYFTTEYIDFSQEANRLKFRDAFGNPVDLAPQIAAGALPNPAIYMRFDPANFGKNSGTGGDFTVSGTITDGGQL